MAARRVLVAIPLPPERRELFVPLEEAGFALLFNELGRALRRDELIARLPEVVATVAGTEPYDEEVFRAAPGLRIVARFGVGHDAVDLAAASRRRVAVAMAFGANHEAVADHAFALMAALAHRILANDRTVRSGGWRTELHRGLHGTTVGILGFGRIGRALARRCRGFEMRVLVHDPLVPAAEVTALGGEPVSLDRLLEAADFVSLHLPLNENTRHLVNAERLARMRPTAFLINTARGGLVDETALAAALREGRIAGAGLDVMAREPPLGSPLLELDNLLLSPHIAGLSEDAVRRMATVCVDNILCLSRGRDPGNGRLLNPEVLTGTADRQPTEPGS